MYARSCTRGGRSSRTAGNFPSKHQCKAERSLLICLLPFSFYIMLHLWPLRNSTTWETSLSSDVEDSVPFFFQIKKFKIFTALNALHTKNEQLKSYDKIWLIFFIEYIFISLHSNLHTIESCSIKSIYHFFTM